MTDIEAQIGHVAAALMLADDEWTTGPNEGYWVYLATTAIAACARIEDAP